MDGTERSLVPHQGTSSEGVLVKNPCSWWKELKEVSSFWNELILLWRDWQMKHLGHSPSNLGIKISGLVQYFSRHKRNFPDASLRCHISFFNISWNQALHSLSNITIEFMLKNTPTDISSPHFLSNIDQTCHHC